MTTLTRLLTHRGQVSPDKPALITNNEVVSYAQLDDLSSRIATKLKARGLKAGSRLGIVAHNSNTIPALLLGAMKLNVVPVQVNWWVKPNELKVLLQHADVEVLLYGNEFEALVESAALTVDVADINGFMTGVSELEPVEEDLSDTEGEAVQIYTSGTTGTPKGIVLTHDNLISLTQSITCDLPGMGYGQIALIAVPLFNIAGMGYLAVSITNGGTAVMLPTFDPERFIATINQHRVTNIFLPPALIFVIAQLLQKNPVAFPSLKLLHYGGAPISEQLLALATAVFKCDMVQGYGLTETSGIVSLLRASDHSDVMASKEVHRVASAGKPVVGVEMKVMSEQGEEVADGEIGELYLKGRSVINSYWKNEYADAFDKGWFKTGDFVSIDKDGYIYIHDRKSDMIITKGINVYPSEIENVLSKHKAVAQVCVLGTPSEEYGQIVSAAVLPVEGGDVDELKEWAKNELAGYKVPRKWKVVEELPKNLAGKVIRKFLRDMPWEN